MLERIKQNIGVGRAMAEKKVQSGNEPESGSVGMDDRGQVAGGMLNKIVALTVGGLVTAFLLPIAINEIAAEGAGTEWSSGAQALWGILDVMIVLGAFLMFVGVALSGSNGM